MDGAALNLWHSKMPLGLLVVLSFTHLPTPYRQSALCKPRNHTSTSNIVPSPLPREQAITFLEMNFYPNTTDDKHAALFISSSTRANTTANLSLGMSFDDTAHHPTTM